MPARQAVGYVLAEAVAAAEDVPPFANSAVDGYAVRVASVTGASRTVRGAFTDSRSIAPPYTWHDSESQVRASPA